MRSVKITNLDINGFEPETEDLIPTSIEDLSDGQDLENSVGEIDTKVSTINLTEQEVNGHKTGKLIFTDSEGDTHEVQGGFPPDDTSIVLTQANKLQAKGLQTSSGFISGDVIKEVISAQGGFLDSHDFGTATPTNEELTDYAIQNIGTITQADEIWDKTKVINLFNHHTWIWDLNSKTWSDLGEIAQISDANNEGLHGLVTGAPNDGEHNYMGNIDANGQININGLPELATAVSGKQDTLINQDNIKSINGNSILGSGDLSITGHLSFPSSWRIYNTIRNLLSDIQNDPTATVGKSYLGEIYCTDLPFGGNAEMIATIIYGSSSYNKIIFTTITSANIAPYYWQYTYGNGYDSGWKTFISADNSIPDFVNYTSYAVGDLVTYRGKFYICTSPYNGTWNSTYFRQVNLKDLFSSLQSQVNTLNTQVQNKQDKYLAFQNIKVSNWTADNTYADYSYKATVALAGVTERMIPLITFSIEDSSSGNYSPVAESYDGGIYIWSNDNTSITIPSLLFFPSGLEAPVQRLSATYFTFDSNNYITGFSVLGQTAYDNGEITALNFPETYSLGQPVQTEIRFYSFWDMTDYGDQHPEAFPMQSVVGTFFDVSDIYSSQTSIENYIMMNGYLSVYVEQQEVLDGDDYQVLGIKENAFQYCSLITSIDLPGTMSYIGNYAFMNCSNLTTVKIHEGVTQLDIGVFNNCRALTSIDIPNSVTYMGTNLFYYCTGLRTATIGTGITNISTQVFRYCTSLQSVTITRTNPPTLGSYVFDNANNCLIYVPASSVNTYKTATNWSTYASRIQAIVS